MKFIDYLETISGVGIYPLTSLLIFFLFFLVVGLKVWFMDKNSVTEIMNLPLYDNETNNTGKNI